MKNDQFLITYGENLQYLLYFSLLGLFGALEFLIPVVLKSNVRKLRWRTNFGLTLINIVVLGALPISGGLVSLYAKENNLGLLNNIEVELGAILLSTFLVRSFSSWLNHWLMHKIPLLWKVHRVHHFDTFLDVSTTVRFHPLEFIINLAITIPFIITFGLPLWALLAYELLDVVINLFSHSNIKLSGKLDQFLRMLIVTPGMHRIHHSSLIEETNSNYGAVFSFWDRLFRTYQYKKSEELTKIDIGLDKERNNASKLKFLLYGQFFK